jgi:hypothetical protein
MGIVLAAASALALAGVLGVADAQQPAPPPAPERLVTVNGGSATDVASDATAATRRAAYGAALGAALDDAKAKAAFVAQRSGLVLGGIQSVTEQTGSVLDGCVAFTESQGAGQARPLPQARRPRRKRGAKTAQAPEPPPGPYRCQAVASVTVSYAVVG